MSIKVSLELVNFKKEMERVRNEVSKQSNLEIEERVDYATETLRVVTPVDTGEARSNWKSETHKDKDGFVNGTIYNKVEYIEYLNKGHSKQAPRYFIEQVLFTIGLITPK